MSEWQTTNNRSIDMIDESVPEGVTAAFNAIAAAAALGKGALGCGAGKLQALQTGDMVYGANIVFELANEPVARCHIGDLRMLITMFNKEIKETTDEKGELIGLVKFLCEAYQHALAIEVEAQQTWVPPYTPEAH